MVMGEYMSEEPKKPRKRRPIAVICGLSAALIGAVAVLVMNAIDAVAQTNFAPLAASADLPTP
jgi:amino acid transporter